MNKGKYNLVGRSVTLTLIISFLIMSVTCFVLSLFTRYVLLANIWNEAIVGITIGNIVIIIAVFFIMAFILSGVWVIISSIIVK